MAYNAYALCYQAGDSKTPETPLLRNNGGMYVYHKPEAAYRELDIERNDLRRLANQSMQSTSFWRSKKEDTKESSDWRHMADTLAVVDISILKGHKDESSETRDTSEREEMAGDVLDVQECDGGDGEQSS